jgi:hypothetical protein
MSETNYSPAQQRWHKYYNLFGHYLRSDLFEFVEDSVVDLKRPEDMTFEERIEFVKNFIIAGMEAKKDIDAHSENPALDTANSALDLFSMLLTVLIEKFLLNRSYPCPETFENNPQFIELGDFLMNIMVSALSQGR